MNEPEQPDTNLVYLESHRDRYPLTVSAYESLLRVRPSYRSILTATRFYPDAYWHQSEARCREILALCSGDEDRFQRSVTEWIKFASEFLRKQQRFVQSGHYAIADVDQLQRDLYQDEDRMQNSYLVALMFSFIFSSNYIGFIQFFQETMLAHVMGAESVCDVGCGHGVYLAQMLLAEPGAFGTGLDISPASLTTTHKLLDYYSVHEARYRLEAGDLRGSLPLDDKTQNCVTCFEVIEHLDDPKHALTELRRILKPNGTLCLSTAIRMESVDHVYLFRHPDEVRSMLESAGFSLLSDRTIPLTNEDFRDPIVLARLIADPRVPLGYVTLVV